MTSEASDANAQTGSEFELMSDKQSTTPQSVANSPPTADFPEGGFLAWVTILGAWLALFSTFGYINAFGVYQDYYTRFYLSNTTPSAVSWIGSFQFFMPLFIGLVVGKLFDQGYFHHLMIAGSTIFVFSLFMLSLAKPHQYYQIFLSQGLGMGLGLGMVFTPAVSIPAHYFRRRRALASGIALSGSSVGAIVHPILLNNLIQKPGVGFAGATRASAYMLLGCLIIANLLMRTRMPPNTQRAPPGSLGKLMKVILTDPAYVLAVTGGFFCLLTVYFPAFYIQLYAVKNGVNLHDAFYSVAILNAGSVVGRILPNFFADKFGPFNMIIPCVLICSGLMFSLLGITSTGSMVPVAIIYGIASGAYLALTIAVVASLARSPAEMGLRIGVSFTVISFAALVGTPIAGALLTPEFHWIRPIIFSAVCVFIGLWFFIAARHVDLRRKAKAAQR